MSTLSSSKYQVGIIGVGVMGEALLAGLVNSGFAKSQIAFAEKREERATEISAKYGASHKEIKDLASTSDVILLVVKPQDLESLLAEYGHDFKSGSLLVSFAAGKTTSFIAGHVGSDVGIIRVMPNTPTLVGLGMAAVSTGQSVAKEQLAFVEEFLATCGKVITIDEKLQDAVTAVSGSGPAYFFAFVEEMIKAATELGLSPEDAKTLTIQTILGAGKMLDESGLTPTTLRENVTSPNGTTAAALNKFSEGKLGELIKVAMIAARDRSQELA